MTQPFSKSWLPCMTPSTESYKISYSTEQTKSATGPRNAAVPFVLDMLSAMLRARHETSYTDLPFSTVSEGEFIDEALCAVCAVLQC